MAANIKPISSTDGKGRQAGIVALLERQGGMSIRGLATQFGCSTATIRRDLASIEASGTALEHYHGSVSLTREDLGTQFEAQRIARYSQKEAIAHICLDYIPDNATIGLNGGTTTTLIARALSKAQKPVRVVTNAVNIAYELALQSMDVVIVGGAVQLPNFESTGKLALRTLADLHLDIAILGVEGVDESFGFSTEREEEAAVADTFRAAADRVVMAFDGSKLGTKALFRLLDWSRVDSIAIDSAGAAQIATWLTLTKTLANDSAEIWNVVR